MCVAMGPGVRKFSLSKGILLVDHVGARSKCKHEQWKGKFCANGTVISSN